jgi:DNA gyrase/topoisomerase IV subunit B
VDHPLSHQEACTPTRSTISTHEGGTHEEVPEPALTTLVNSTPGERDHQEKDENLTGGPGSQSSR